MRAVDIDEMPVPFSLKVVEYNEQAGTGGKFLEVDRAVITQSGKRSERRQGRNAMRGLSSLSDHEKLVKDPNHWDNLTLNITILPSGNIRKIHIHLITRINGERVY